MVCLGFVQHPETFKGHVTRLDGNFFNDKSAEWFINVGGDMVSGCLKCFEFRNCIEIGSIIL